MWCICVSDVLTAKSVARNKMFVCFFSDLFMILTKAEVNSNLLYDRGCISEQYDTVYLTCSKKLTVASLVYHVEWTKKVKEKIKINWWACPIVMKVQSHYHECRFIDCQKMHLCRFWMGMVVFGTESWWKSARWDDCRRATSKACPFLSHRDTCWNDATEFIWGATFFSPLRSLASA